MPDIPALQGLRHKWYWERRPRPYVPVWNFAKMPRPTLPIEENARLLSVYMRPWTLNHADVSEHTPLLTDLRSSKIGLRSDCETSPANVRKTYAEGWRQYLKGNVVSDTNRKYIQNLLSATAARAVEQDEDSDLSSNDDLEYDRKTRDIGNMAVVQKTLEGLAASTDADEIDAIRKHATTMALGRSLWASPQLTAKEIDSMKAQPSSYPISVKDAKAALMKHCKESNQERHAPFANATAPASRLDVVDYRQRFDAWFRQLMQEEETPNTEQLLILTKVRDRILTEIEVQFASSDYYIRDNRKCKQHNPLHEPLHGLSHGFPGTGKSRVIKWLIRMFQEVMHWTQGREFACVAFQNRVAHAMNGSTLHSDGELRVGVQNYSAMLESKDVDTLFTKNESKRWLIVDEVFMVPDTLLESYERNYQEAAPRGPSNPFFPKEQWGTTTFWRLEHLVFRGYEPIASDSIFTSTLHSTMWENINDWT